MRNEFSHLFENKIVLFVQELLSVFTSPWILWVSLPRRCDKIIDFFREFSVHVDSIGYVCSFAVFDFKRHGNHHYGAPVEHQDTHYFSKAGKMESSFLSFKMANPEWEPSLEGSAYLATVMSRQRNISSGSHDAGPSESMMMASVISNDNAPQTFGNNVFGLLDAVYESNRKIL